MPPKPHYRLPGDVIFVVSPDAQRRYVMERQLFRLGPAVVTFGTGAELLDAIRSEDFGCVLIDPLPPAVDPVAILNALKTAAPRLVSVVIVSADEVDLAPAVHRAGAFDTPLAPVSADRLRDVVSTALAASRERSRQSTRQGASGERHD